MRIALRLLTLLPIAVLTACAAGQPVSHEHASGRYDTSAAERLCLARGYSRGTYDFQTCYANQPQVQAWERDGRMNGLAIISANRSPKSYLGRSYPVD